jgi:hypothetical protein
MDQPPRQVPLGFTDERFPAGTHMCLIYDNDDDRRQLIGKFLGSGLAEGEKVAYFADTATPAEAAAWLTEAGVGGPNSAEASGFSISDAGETYCPNSRFVPEEMLDTLRAFHGAVIEEGRVGGRVSGEMSWALRGIPGSDRLIEYEALVNDVLATHPITAICQYDADRFDGATIFDVLRVHPAMVVGGQVLRNPYYMDPQQFLETRR